MCLSNQISSPKYLFTQPIFPHIIHGILGRLFTDALHIQPGNPMKRGNGFGLPLRNNISFQVSSHQLFKNLLKLLLRTHINIKFIISVFKNPTYSALGKIMTFFPSQFSVTPIWPNLRPFVETWRRDSQLLSCPTLYFPPILDPWQFLLRDLKKKTFPSFQITLLIGKKETSKSKICRLDFRVLQGPHSSAPVNSFFKNI